MQSEGAVVLVRETRMRAAGMEATEKTLQEPFALTIPLVQAAEKERRVEVRQEGPALVPWRR